MKKAFAFIVPTHMPGYGGWGNGYVALPEGHPCYGKDYDTIMSEYPQVHVNGGLTYSKKGYGKEGDTKDMWVIGFDTLHFGDTMEKWPEQNVRAEADWLLEQMEEIAETAAA